VSRKQEEGGGGGRRYFLLTAIRTEITAATIFINPLKTNAAAPMDAGEAIRRSAANIPGYGPTDVFFPSGLVGSWTMNREVEIGGRTIKLSYPFRFIQSIEDDAVVADRGSNQAELEKSLIETLTGNSKEASSFVLSYEWAINNPNDLRLVLADGTKKEIKVTKRATERSEATVTSSEFQRVTQENQRGIPVISARRILTKWKIIDDSTIEGIEVIYSMGGGDPMAGASGAAQPSILSKSRLFLIR
jgi:hypothetical protein